MSSEVCLSLIAWAVSPDLTQLAGCTYSPCSKRFSPLRDWLLKNMRVTWGERPRAPSSFRHRSGLTHHVYWQYFSSEMLALLQAVIIRIYYYATQKIPDSCGCLTATFNYYLANTFLNLSRKCNSFTSQFLYICVKKTLWSQFLQYPWEKST